MPTLVSAIQSSELVACRPGNTAARFGRNMIIMLSLLAAIGLGDAAGAEADRESPIHEKIIRAYFAGWERKDWDQVARQLAPGFTFTSPAPDDHISTEQFKAKCWNQAEHIVRFEFPKIIGDEREALAIVHVVTTDNRVIRNIEYFTFRDGRIQSIEVFFGGSGLGFPTNQK